MDSSVNSTARLSTLVRLAVLASLVGLISAYAALGFVLGIGWVQSFMMGSGGMALLSAIEEAPWWRVLLAPTLGGLLVGLMVRFVMPGPVSQGPADVIGAVQAHDARMPLRRGLLSAAASVVSIGSGASVGRYGPAVHLGATLGSWLARHASVDRSARVALLGAGVASAIAAAFNAPLAGVLFAHEVVIGGFAVRTVMPVVLASAVGVSVVRAHGSELALFALTDQTIQQFYEYPLFVAVGILGGGLAIVFMRSVDLAVRHARRIPSPSWMRPMLGGFIIGFIALGFPEVFGLGEDVIHRHLSGEYALWFLFALIAAKIVATSCSLGFGFYGGILGPALFVGAALGQAFGLTLDSLWPGILSHGSVYAVAGMGAVVSRVAGAPIATILIVFELTSSYTLTTGAMIAVVVASVVWSRRFPGSYYEFQVEARGIDAYRGRVVTLMQGGEVRDRMRSAGSVLPTTTPVSKALQYALAGDGEELFITGEDGRLIGSVSLRELVVSEREGRADDLVGKLRSSPVRVTADTDLHSAMIHLGDFIGICVPVIENDSDPRVVGALYQSDLMAAYDTAVATARAEDRGS